MDSYLASAAVAVCCAGGRRVRVSGGLTFYALESSRSSRARICTESSSVCCVSAYSLSYPAGRTSTHQTSLGLRSQSTARSASTRPTAHWPPAATAPSRQTGCAAGAAGSWWCWPAALSSLLPARRPRCRAVPLPGRARVLRRSGVPFLLATEQHTAGARSFVQRPRGLDQVSQLPPLRTICTTRLKMARRGCRLRLGSWAFECGSRARHCRAATRASIVSSKDALLPAAPR